MAKKAKQPQAPEGGSVFERAGSDQPKDQIPADNAGPGLLTPDSPLPDTASDQVETSPATAAAVPASEPPPTPRGGVKCNGCSTDTETVWCYPVAPGWVQCPICKCKQRNLSSLKAAMRGRGGKSRAAR